MKCSDKILYISEVDPGLSADAGVDLRQQRGGSLNHRDPAHVHRCCKACDIADNTTPDSNHGGLASHMKFGESIEQTRDRRKTLGAFTLGNKKDGVSLLEYFPHR